jgi:hypothetical protein
MAEDDFEIDIYGDESTDQQGTKPQDDGQAEQHDGADGQEAQDDTMNHEEYAEQEHYNGEEQYEGHNQDTARSKTKTPHGDAKPPQGTKRKSESVSDERPVDPGATTALLMSELNWWDTDDDIRGWTRDAGAEDELEDITFSEHKANGKSKG